MRFLQLKKSFVIVLVFAFIFSSAYKAFSANINNFAAADKLIQSGKYADAEKILLAQYKTNPRSVPLLLKLADVSLKKNDFKSAMNYLNWAFKLQPENPAIFQTAAELMRENSQYSQSEWILQNLTAKNPSSIDNYILLGKVFLEDYKKNKEKLTEEERLNILNQSLTNIKRASALSPVNADIHIELAKVYLEMEKTSKAYDEVLAADDLGIQDTKNLYFLADFYFNNGNLNKAVKILQRPELYNQKKSDKSHLILAETYEKLGDFESAKKEYDIALQIFPNNKAVIEKKNRLLEIEKSLIPTVPVDDSLQLTQATEAEASQISKAFFYLITDRFLEGRNLYNKVLEDNPESIYAKEGLIENYYSQWLNECFNPKNYFVDYEFLENLPDVEELKIADVKFKMMIGASSQVQSDAQLAITAQSQPGNYLETLNSARAYFLLKEYALSAEQTKSLINSVLPEPELYRIGGYLILDQNYYQAQRIFLSLVGKMPPEQIDPVLERITFKLNNADSVFNEGKVFYEKRKYDKASQKFNQVIRTVPEHKLSHLYYAYSLRKKKDKQNSLKEIKLYQELNTLYPSLQDGNTPEITNDKLQKTISTWETENFKKK